MSAFAVEGGLRDRLVAESFVRHVKAGLTAKGWFESGVPAPPVVVVTTHLPDTSEMNVDANTYVVVLVEDSSDVDAEVGSGLTEDRTTGWVDVYAKTDAIAAHLSGDVRDLLRGKLPSVGYDTAGFTVRNWFVTDPDDLEDLFWVDVEDVQRDRDPDQSRATRFHYQVSAELVEFRP